MMGRPAGRLIENLLAYARITDLTETYAFEPLEVAAVFNDIQQDFEAPLDAMGSSSRSHRAGRAPGGDRFALRLLFGNRSTTRSNNRKTPPPRTTAGRG